MIVQTNAIAAPTSVAAGAPTSVSMYEDKTVTLENPGTATYQLQISCDSSASPAATSWINEGAPLTAAGALEVTKPCQWVRWNCTAFTNGAPTSRVAGVTHAQVLR